MLWVACASGSETAGKGPLLSYIVLLLQRVD